MAAFFKLALQDGSEREWRSLSAVVGRASSGRERDDLIDLGEQPRLSREHLAIFYDPAKRRWMAKVLSKNGAEIGKEYHETGALVELSQRTPMRLGACKMWFLLPIS